ncbi:unnamed protein product [Brachionus calyciflorus]|uniref:Uncharacterized protein n=1 Tax=Brachionus calyciflorus TaxID=104777 RepID=A0A814PRI7_9BILA|nr:unnamed protein product [Brachionus calyciflorus]
MSETKSRNMYLLATSAICLASLAYWLWKKNSIEDLKKIFKKPDKSLDRASVNDYKVKNFKKKNFKVLIPKTSCSSPRPMVKIKKNHYDEWWTNLSQRGTSSDVRVNRPSNGSRRSGDEENEISNKLSKLKISIDSKNDNEITTLVDRLLKTFKQLDSNQKIEFSSYILELSQFHNLKLIHLIDLLNSEYSHKNQDLFENYKFNNTLGELSTEIVLNILKAFYNLSQNKQIVREAIESELYCDLVYELFSSYIFDLEKNKNNVKRIRKIQAIKFYTIKILSKTFEFLKKDEFEDIRQTVYFKNSIKLAKSILNGRIIEINYEPGETRTSSFDVNLIDKVEFFKSYILFIENLLYFVSENQEFFSSLKNTPESFVDYLFNQENFIQKMDSIKTNDLFKDQTNAIFDYLIKIKQNLTSKEENLVEKKCLDDISLDSELNI